jgi:hypothetical protein
MLTAVKHDKPRFQSSGKEAVSDRHIGTNILEASASTSRRVHSQTTYITDTLQSDKSDSTQ